jgi:nicotinate-nucleotide adenylyltransferase
MKIGIFPGSFNPIHIGHLAIANYICEFEGYDEIWFLITPQNPVKGQTDLINKELRLALVEDSIKDYPQFKTCTIEWEMSPPTYTVNTLQKLRVRYPQFQFELIIGSDNWEIFHRWKDYQMILKNFRLLVYPRKGGGNILANHPNVRISRQAPKIEVSSSFIRKALKKGKDIRFFLPRGNYEKIIESGFFGKEETTKEEIHTEEPLADKN